MTATTKEQRDAASLYIEMHTALQATFPADFVLALLSDSERLAAIEAVTGEEVRELVDGLHKSADELENGPYVSLKTAREEYRTAATALLSLSAKVAEHAEEIERLKRHLSDEERQHEQTIHDRDEAEEAIRWLDQQTGGDGEYVFNTLEPHTCNCTPSRMCKGIAERHSVVRTERDTLRRLLTETAVPALDNARLCIDGPVAECAQQALSTIRAQMENVNA